MVYTNVNAVYKQRVARTNILFPLIKIYRLRKQEKVATIKKVNYLFLQLPAT